jgi:hypothetical protein
MFMCMWLSQALGFDGLNGPAKLPDGTVLPHLRTTLMDTVQVVRGAGREQPVLWLVREGVGSRHMSVLWPVRTPLDAHF